MRVDHGGIPPLFDKESRALILGTMPSPKSREAAFYYAHPQNRFWRVLAAILGENCPETAEGRAALCHRRHIALWDVLASCEIEGAADSTIRAPEPNDIAGLLKQAPIRAVFTTGTTATKLYQRLLPVLPRAIHLPSNITAKCRIRFEELVERYRVILNYL